MKNENVWEVISQGSEARGNPLINNEKIQNIEMKKRDGVAFDKKDSEEIAKMLGKKFVWNYEELNKNMLLFNSPPDDRHNESPMFSDFLAFLKKYSVAKAFGRCGYGFCSSVPDSKYVCIDVDAIQYIGDASKICLDELISDFKNLTKKADTRKCRVDNSRKKVVLSAWWD